jgi:hypothetical protein
MDAGTIPAVPAPARETDPDRQAGADSRCTSTQCAVIRVGANGQIVQRRRSCPPAWTELNRRYTSHEVHLDQIKSMNGMPMWPERQLLQRVVQVVAFVMAAAAFTLMCVGNRSVATVAVCPTGGSAAAYVVEGLFFLSPAALFAAGGRASRRARTRLASVLWIIGICSAVLMFLFAWLLLLGVTMNCANASGAETDYFIGAWAFAFAAGAAGIGRALQA